MILLRDKRWRLLFALSGSAILVAACGAPSAGSATAESQHFVWSMQVASPDSPTGGGTQLSFLAKQIKKLTQGAVTLNIYFSSGLQLDNTQIAQLAGRKVVDAIFTPSAGSAIPEVDEVSLPGVVPAPGNGSSMETFRKKVMGELGPTYTKLFEGANLVYLAGFIGSPYDVLSRKTSRTLTDLEGQKLVTVGALNAGLISSFHATPVTNLTQADWYTSLQTGVINGVFTNASTLYANKVYELAKSLLELNVAGAGIYLAVNKSDWTALGKNLQKDVSAAVSQFAAQYWNFQYKAFDSDIALMQQQGVSVNSLSASDQSEVNAASSTIVANYEASATSEEISMLAKIRAAVKRYGQ